MPPPCEWPWWRIEVKDPETDFGAVYRQRAATREAADADGRVGFTGLNGTAEQRDRLEVTVELVEEAA